VTSGPPELSLPAARAGRGDTAMDLVWPAERYLPSYVAALESGWSPDNARPEAAIREQLAKIAQDPAAFVRELVDREAKGPPVIMPDGSTVPRLPSYRKWMWDGEFCGSIGFRWQPGASALPPHVLGHIGYAVVPWKRGRGYATRALKLILADARSEGLGYVELTTDPDNVPSQRVITANGGVLVEQFVTSAQLGESERFRFRIEL
jgi:predicted acetyltransferase